MHDTPPLVAGRTCGECIACCQIPSIEEPGLTKPAGALCRHCTGSSCGIYAARPQTCREFHCQWRHLALLDENWRPDRSGVLISSRSLGDEADSAAAMVVVVFGDHAVIFDDGFATLVAMSVDRGIEVFLSLPFGTGQRAHETPLRPFVAGAVAAGSLAGVKAGIETAYAGIWPDGPG
jgi:hypothetical protein